MLSTASLSENCMQQPPISAIVTICAQQKRFRPETAATPAALDKKLQSEVELAWQHIVACLPEVATASDLYAGRSFGLAKVAAVNSKAPLFVISAGLGLISGDTLAPAYGLTVARNVPESIASKVDGEFDPQHWFSSLMASGRSVGWEQVGCDGSGLILVALTKPYAEMVGESLAKASPKILERVRIFGANLSRALPEALHPAIAPYDDRLDTIAPGTKSDFAQRALLHFVDCVAVRPSDRRREFETVSALLSRVTAPQRPNRMQRSDAELISLIRERIQPRASASSLLRQLRDNDGIACEQGRFARLFRTALIDEAAA